MYSPKGTSSLVSANAFGESTPIIALKNCFGFKNEDMNVVDFRAVSCKNTEGLEGVARATLNTNESVLSVLIIRS